MRSLDVDKIISLIEGNMFTHSFCFNGEICSGSSEDENGMFLYVELSGDEEERAFVEHSVVIDNISFYCHEYQDSSRQWYIDNDPLHLDDEHIEDLLKSKLDLLVSPFDFEEFALDSFDGDAISESIPYGDPYCLKIANCVFMIEEDGDQYDEKMVRDFLREYGWSDEKIESAMIDGFELIDDVWDEVSSLPVKYIEENT